MMIDYINRVYSLRYIVKYVYRITLLYFFILYICANSRFLGLVSVWAARSFDQTALRPSVIKRIHQIDVKYITHITSFGVTCVKTHV